MHTKQFIITGKVQGVWFRQSTKNFATEKGLKGSVENMKDGSVKIIATGTSPQLDELYTWCRTGPPRARVDAVDAKEISLRHFNKFSIL